ncbi:MULTISPECIES: hypothetical protein [unclassified Nitrospina]
MSDLFAWFDNFLAQLPPLLQLIAGLLGGIAVFKLLSWFFALLRGENKTE